MRKLERFIIISFIALSSMMITTDIEAKQTNSNIFPIAMGMRGKVTNTNVNIRTAPSLSSQVIGCVSNTNVMVTGKHKNWYRIRYKGEVGWMSRQYLSVPDAVYVPDVSLLGEQIAEYGKKFIGTPYVWGGTNLRQGVDCSGFTQCIYKEFDININRTSTMQAHNGKTISKNELRSGDLVFFDTNGINKGNISHVGIYVGNGQFIHSNSSRGISIANLSNSYYQRNYVKSIRIPGV